MNASTMESDMDMDMDPVDEVWLQKIYWSAIGAVVAAFTIVNLYSRFLAWQRRRSGGSTAARPKTWPAVMIASLTAIVREVSNSTITRFTIKGYAVYFPTIGKVSLVLINIAVLLSLCFYKLGPSYYPDFENIGYRTGRITACQLPLLFLLAGKRNIIGTLTGYSYERINWLHRWAARCMLLTTTIHMGYWFMDWARYDYIATRVAIDVMTRQGLAAWSILMWITFSSMAPIRGWRYEFFLIQHIISFAGLVGAIYIHITPTDVEFVWITVGVFFFDRLARAGYYLYNNLFKIRNSSHATGKLRDFWGSRAHFFALPGGYTRVIIDTPPTSWKPGQHVLLSCQALVPLQAHPFTICSIPSDGTMEFIVESKTGGTKRLYRHAEKLLPEHRNDAFAQKTVAIEGPYGHVRPLQQFDTVTLYAGGTGATFTMPLFRDLVHSWKTQSSVVTRRIRFVWVIRSGKQLEWFREQINQALQEISDMRAQHPELQVRFTVYVTCDDTFTSQHKSLLSGETGFIAHTMPVDCSPPVIEFTGLDEKSHQLGLDEKKTAIASEGVASSENCCCQTDITDEEDGDSIAAVCQCEGCGTHQPHGDSASSLSELGKVERAWLHPDLHVYSGRPQIKDIMRSSLESALGESAVVACGPYGLTHDVRHAMVSLSDERAVHKGTGAQGIWLHTEAFSY